MSDYFTRVVKPYYSLPADSGTKDPALLALGRMLDLSKPTLLLDFGCGQGRLLSALLECRTKTELAQLQYVGVDLSDEASKKAQAFFDSNFVDTGARSCFLSSRLFDAYVADKMLFDQIAVIFAVHEFEPLDLHMILSILWRMLRRGGRIYIQDTAAPIHKEVEFLALAPDCILQILEAAGAEVSFKVIKSGKHDTPVYIVVGAKSSAMPVYSAYVLPSLATITRQILHRSMLTDCLALANSRDKVNRGEHVESEEVAALCHRIATKARAFHQSMALDEVRSLQARYCIYCGSPEVEVRPLAETPKDPAEVSIRCMTCSRHFHCFIENLHDEFAWTLPLLVFLDEGNVDAELAKLYICNCLGVPDRRYLDVVLPTILRIQGVSTEIIGRALRMLGRPVDFLPKGEQRGRIDRKRHVR